MTKTANKFYDIDGTIVEIEPTSPTENTKGGFYAKSVEDTSNMVEVVLGKDGKGYVDLSKSGGEVNQDALYDMVLGGSE